MTTLTTYTYSNRSIDELKNLLSELSKVFPCVEKDLSKLFDYGVFMDATMYANNYLIKSKDNTVIDKLPPELSAPCQTPDNRIDFVRDTIEKIMKGEITKPDWMKYLEEELVCGSYALPPSTLLYLRPKDEKYKSLGDAIKKFLYSTDHITDKVEECKPCSCKY